MRRSWSHCLGPSPTDQNFRFGKSLWQTDLMSLRDLCFLMPNALKIVCDSGASTPNYLILLVCRELAGGTGWGPQQASFLLSCTGHLPTWSCKKEPKVQWRRACSFWSEPKSDLTDVLSAVISSVYLGNNQWTATKLNGSVIPFSLPLSPIFFFKDTKTEKPNPLNNSYFDLQKTTNISSEQGKHVFSCIWVQEH